MDSLQAFLPSSSPSPPPPPPPPLPPLSQSSKEGGGGGEQKSEEEGEGRAVEDEEYRRKMALKAAGAHLFSSPSPHDADPHKPCLQGLLVQGWRIQTSKHFILSMDERDRWERVLGTRHLPEMLFGSNFLELAHLATGLKITFNALDALHGWKQENLPPVEVSAAPKWQCRSKPSEQVILDYDYTFTTPYSGSETIGTDEGLLKCQLSSKVPVATTNFEASTPQWVACEEKIDLEALRAKDPILFYDEVVLYEDELADNGVSLLSVKVRVMPSFWFLLLRFWLRVDGVLMRIRDTRMCCSFQDDPSKAPIVIREQCHKEETFSSLALKGFPVDSSLYDASFASERLTVQKQQFEKLIFREKI